MSEKPCTQLKQFITLALQSQINSAATRFSVHKSKGYQIQNKLDVFLLE